MRPAIWQVLLLVGMFSSPAPGADTPGGGLRIVCAQPMRQNRKLRLLVPEAAELRVALYDMLGRRIGERDFRTAGRRTLLWDLACYALPAGTYFLVADYGGRRDVRKLLILR